MLVPSHADLIDAIDAFQCRHPDIKDARFGREATGEPGLVAGLRRGRSPTLNLLERLAGYMRAKDEEAGLAVAHADGECAAGACSSSGKPEEVSAPVTALS